MAGYRVVEAASSAEALRQLGSVKADLLLAALDLPGGAGELLEQMRRDPALAQIPALGLANTPQQAAEPGQFQLCLVRGDREGMLRSIEHLACALAGEPEPAGAKG